MNELLAMGSYVAIRYALFWSRPFISGCLLWLQDLLSPIVLFLL
jgi:hypothetical protein